MLDINSSNISSNSEDENSNIGAHIKERYTQINQIDLTY